MVNEAEKYKEEDEKQRDRIAAKNELESYAFNLKATVEDDKMKGKISDEDRATIANKTKEVLNWLESNQVKFVSKSWCKNDIGLSSSQLAKSLFLQFEYHITSTVRLRTPRRIGYRNTSQRVAVTI